MVKGRKIEFTNVAKKILTAETNFFQEIISNAEVILSK